ncbi:MAG TPA: hypothetical protein VH641_07440 [Streptosporangiaceae bacterium]|jgi:hypothetical protein
MPGEPLVCRVEVSFVGAAPAQRVARASGVSDVQADGSVLRCLVCGSFQPFLEALRGHEVTGFSSVAARGDPAPRAVRPGAAAPSVTPVGTR